MPHPTRDASLPLGVSVSRSPDAQSGPVLTVVLHRPTVRNAVDGPTARALFTALVAAERDPTVRVVVLYGAGGSFCAGADLAALSRASVESVDENPATSASNPLQPVQPYPVANDDGAMHAHVSDMGPMGLSRLQLTKPVIAAIAGHAVAGGLELACWADLRVVEEGATFGVFCRRFGVPLIDGGTVRLPRLIGHSRAMDLILTGRPVDAQEAFQIGLANRIVPTGTAREAAETLALQLASFPQRCMRADRWSVLQQHGKPERLALEHEFAQARDIVREESLAGAKRFAQGQGRHGEFATSHSLVALTASSIAAANHAAAGVSSAAAPALASSASSSRIRCVLFDLGGVVVDSPVRAILQYERSLGLPPHALNILLGRSLHFHALERGELSLDQFEPLMDAEMAERAAQMGMASNAAQSSADNAATSSSSSHALFELMGSVAPRRAMLASIALLRRAGVVVGAVTNNWKATAGDARGCMIDQLDDVFDFVVESCVAKVRKPDRRIFEMAVQRANEVLHERARSNPPLRAEEIVFLDDLGGNLKSARQMGIQTIKVAAAYGRALQQLASVTGVELDLCDAPMDDKPLAVRSGLPRSEQASGSSAGPELRAKL